MRRDRKKVWRFLLATKYYISNRYDKIRTPLIFIAAVAHLKVKSLNDVPRHLINYRDVAVQVVNLSQVRHKHANQQGVPHCKTPWPDFLL